MTCQDCADARRQGCCHHTYTLNCDGCKARILARSLAAWKSICRGDSEELKRALQRNFPKMPVKESKQLVWSWWDADHEKEPTS